MKWDKKAVVQTVGLLIISWAAFPFIYYMLVKMHKKEVEKEDGNKVGIHIKENTKGGRKNVG